MALNYSNESYEKVFINRSIQCTIRNIIDGILETYKMEKNPNWKGGLSKNRDGYLRVRKPNHPFGVYGYILKHRLVMEKHLKRYLKPKEVVHHINGNVQDNRIENLELFKNQGFHYHNRHKKIK